MGYRTRYVVRRIADNGFLSETSIWLHHPMFVAHVANAAQLPSMTAANLVAYRAGLGSDEFTVDLVSAAEGN